MLTDAKWIKPPALKEAAGYEFYIKFNALKPVKKGVLTASAAGMYIPYLNEKRVGDEVFAPYWTSYHNRIQYQEYDVTEYIKEENELVLKAGDGWAVGGVCPGENLRHVYFDCPAVIFTLYILYEDNTEEILKSDNNVKVRTSDVLYSDIYMGETVDRSIPKSELGLAEIADIKTNLIPQQGEKVKEHERISPFKLIVTPKGEKVIDFGQNLAGYVEIRIKGKNGDRIRITHAEVLDFEGNFYTDNLRGAKQENTYILSGEGEEVFKPSFSWQGFRYIRLDEYPLSEVDLSSFTAIAVHSDIKHTGYFSCGNEKINQLYHNIIWGQKSNFNDVPTDCPQRDERAGWTGDAQLFVRTAAINFDVEKFFTKWLSDLALEQGENGEVYAYIPVSRIGKQSRVASGWGDAATICPWEVYLAYGNPEILKRQFESMKKWVDYIHNFGEEEFLWLGGRQFGDWLAMDNGEGSYEGATSKDYISSAYFAKSTKILIKAGKILGLDMKEYEELYDNIVKTFKRTFIKDGLPIDKTQTAYVIALTFGLYEDREKTASGLAEMIRENDTKLTTGFLGTPHLLHALSENGYKDIAYDLLLQEEFPSWLYSVNHGATTMWEHWDCIKENNTFWDTAMNSFNHYAYGSVYDWIFGVAAGIKPLEDGAGYRHILIKPMPDKRLGFLNAGLKTRLGEVSSSWYYNEEGLHFEITVPKGATAEIELPDGRKETVCGGNYLYKIAL